MSDRFAELQARNINNLMISGIALIVAWPVAWFLVPFGFLLGAALAVLGVITIVRAIALKARLERQRQKQDKPSG